ncbi:nucleolar protein,Nop52-domain-containing protein [Elsinoe ampelina]|uniref:Nucleolar protein,Nop52-domain-containing protein n=1 Tax=Elsinoe ampelina TaxID=302913 RepID=A0A6A6G686_9PEZI|nr:nucleolar protein,Nop52-domain-containing protein [Elsinoe ampelina]
MAQPDLSLPEGPLLRALASSSLSRRRAAMASLSTFLSKKQNFTQLDFLKLWKGLFYCLYMTPKMLHQQRLSIEISELTYALQETPTSQGEEFLSFVRAFWTTIAREWEGIDKARLDKFLFLVRRMVFVGFEGCKVSSGSIQDPEEYEWSPALLSSYLEILKQGPLDAGNMKLPIGLQLHVLDVLVDEMERADPERKLDTQEVVGILEGLKRESKTKTVRKRAGEVLQEGGLGDWATAEGGTGGDQDEEEKENEEEDGEDGFEGFDD